MVLQALETTDMEDPVDQGAGAGLGTQTDAMQQSAQHVRAVQEGISADLAGLRARLADMPGLWKGPAGVAFVALMGRWDRDATMLSQALMGIGEQLQASGTTYSNNEAEQQAAIGRVAGGGSITQALSAKA